MVDFVLADGCCNLFLLPPKPRSRKACAGDIHFDAQRECRTQSDPCQIDMHGRADQKLQHVLFDLVGVVELLRLRQRHGIRVGECAGVNLSENNANTIQNIRADPSTENRHTRARV